jgi:hypothetical protein
VLVFKGMGFFIQDVGTKINALLAILVAVFALGKNH